MTTLGNECDALVKGLKLQMGNRQHIYIAELYERLKRKRNSLQKAYEEDRRSPSLEKEIAALESNIIYQIKNPISPEKETV
jgi:hypothetical protein